jgi:uncharacterized membrane protein
MLKKSNQKPALRSLCAIVLCVAAIITILLSVDGHVSGTSCGFIVSFCVAGLIALVSSEVDANPYQEKGGINE